MNEGNKNAVVACLREIGDVLFRAKWKGEGKSIVKPRIV